MGSLDHRERIKNREDLKGEKELVKIFGLYEKIYRFWSNNGGGSVKELSKKGSTKDASIGKSHHVNRVNSDKSKSQSTYDSKKEPAVPKDGPMANIAAQTFTFRELATATNNFRPECLLGEGGFGHVYKGLLDSTGQLLNSSIETAFREIENFSLKF
ncbi:hypothetical protein GQ457_01G030970 [Hibiscus cannabinus]